jgi:hypothetical protein
MPVNALTADHPDLDRVTAVGDDGREALDDDVDLFDALIGLLQARAQRQVDRLEMRFKQRTIVRREAREDPVSTQERLSARQGANDWS